MLKVEVPFELGDNVQIIEIAEQDLPEFSDGTIGVIAGWGSTEYGGPISFQLHSVELQTINNEECSELNTVQPVTENMLCAQPLGDTDAGMCHVRFICLKLKWFLYGFNVFREIVEVVLSLMELLLVLYQMEKVVV